MTVTFQVGDREFGGAGNLEIDFWVGASLSRAVDTVCSGAETCGGILAFCAHTVSLHTME